MTTARQYIIEQVSKDIANTLFIQRKTATGIRWNFDILDIGYYLRHLVGDLTGTFENGYLKHEQYYPVVHYLDQCTDTAKRILHSKIRKSAKFLFDNMWNKHTDTQFLIKCRDGNISDIDVFEVMKALPQNLSTSNPLKYLKSEDLWRFEYRHECSTGYGAGELKYYSAQTPQHAIKALLDDLELKG